MNITAKFNYSVIALTLTSIALSTHADVVPNAGQLLQQEDASPWLQSTPKQVEIAAESPHLDQVSGNQTVAIQLVQLTGNHSISSETLHSQVADAEGQTLSLTQLQQLANRITHYYQQHGYPYARAYLPEQNLSQGKVTIAVLEAQYDQINTNNHSRTRDSLLQATIRPLKSGDVISQAKLERQIKLLNRLPGVSTTNTIRAGSQTGTSSLDIDVNATPLLKGYVGVDNFGNEYTGIARFNGGIGTNNLLGLGDSINLEASTTGKRYNYAKLAYEMALNGAGTRAGASYSIVAYKLGKDMQVLDAKGQAEQASLWVSHPLWLDNRNEVVLSGIYDHKRLQDDINLSQTHRHRNIDVGRVRVDGFHYDTLGGGGLTQWGVGVHIGHTDIQDAQTKAIDALTRNTQGGFHYYTANLGRLQNLGHRGTQLYTFIQGQYSPDNLDGAEGFSVGGPYTLSGYKTSMLGGMSGYYAVTELRQNLLNTHRNQLNAKVFLDTAQARFVSKKWNGFTGRNSDRISSTGLGLDWSNAQQWQIQAKVGFPVGNQANSTDKRNDAQFWVNVNKRF